MLSGKETAKIVITEQMRVDYLNGDYVPEGANTTAGLDAALASQRKGGLWVLVCWFAYFCAGCETSRLGDDVSRHFHCEG